MKTDRHMKIAGVLQMVQSIPLLLFGGYYIISIIQAFLNDSQGWGELPEVILMILAIAFIFVYGVVLAWFGYSLIMQKQWTTRVGGLLCSIAGCLLFPHIISIYTLWVWLQANKGEKP